MSRVCSASTEEKGQVLLEDCKQIQYKSKVKSRSSNCTCQRLHLIAMTSEEYPAAQHSRRIESLKEDGVRNFKNITLMANTGCVNITLTISLTVYRDLDSSFASSSMYASVHG